MSEERTKNALLAKEDFNLSKHARKYVYKLFSQFAELVGESEKTREGIALKIDTMIRERGFRVSVTYNNSIFLHLKKRFLISDCTVFLLFRILLRNTWLILISSFERFSEKSVFLLTAWWNVISKSICLVKWILFI